jgi:hypothetical protein
MLHKDSTGWAINAALKDAGAVEALAFAEWWTAETFAAVLHAYVVEKFPGSTLIERAGGEFMSYSIPSSGCTLSGIFAAFESQRERIHIADYSLGQMSLESVFNQMAVSWQRNLARVGAPPFCFSPHYLARFGLSPAHNLTHTHIPTHHTPHKLF